MSSLDAASSQFRPCRVSACPERFRPDVDRSRPFPTHKAREWHAPRRRKPSGCGTEYADGRARPRRRALPSRARFGPELRRVRHADSLLGHSGVHFQRAHESGSTPTPTPRATPFFARAHHPCRSPAVRTRPRKDSPKNPMPARARIVSDQGESAGVDVATGLPPIPYVLK